VTEEERKVPRPERALEQQRDLRYGPIASASMAACFQAGSAGLKRKERACSTRAAR